MRAVEDRGGVDGGWKGNNQSIDPSIRISEGGEGIDRSGGEHSPLPRHNAVVSRKEWYRKTGKEVMEGRPLLHHLLGFKSRCKGCLKLIIMMLF